MHASFAIDRSSISRQYALLYLDDGNRRIEDLNSMNDTFVNEQRIRGRTHPD